MPIYSFKCTVCGLPLDEIQDVPGKEAQPCPRCLNPMVREFTAPAVIHIQKGAGE